MTQLSLLDLLTNVQPEPIASAPIKPANDRPILMVWRQFGETWHYTGQMGYADRLELREKDRALSPGIDPNLQNLQTKRPKSKESEVKRQEQNPWQQAKKDYYLELAQRFWVRGNWIARFYFWLIMQDAIRTMRCAALHLKLAHCLQLLKNEHDRIMEMINDLH